MKKIALAYFVVLLNSVALSQPVIGSFAPASGSVGSSVVISGSNFNTTPSLNIVYFGATKATVNNASLNSLTVTVPLGSNHSPLSVLNATNNLIGYSSHYFRTTFLCPGTITTTALAPKVDFAGGAHLVIETGDLDNDGKSDMIACVNHGNGSITVSVYRNTSSSATITSASFAPFQTFTVSGGEAMTLGDINGDGKLDLVLCSYSNNSISLFKNTSSPGAVSLDPPVDLYYTSGSVGPSEIAVDDLDMDGKTDIVTANYSNGKVSVFKNTGTVNTLTFAPNVDFNAMSSTFGLTIADFDGDGKKDIAAANTFSGVSVFRNTATTGIINAGSFASAVNFTFTQGTAAVEADDVDGDSKIDLVMSSVLNNNVYIMRNTASPGTITASSFAAPVTYTAGGTSNGLLVGDLNGDGKSEIVIPHNSTFSVSIFQNNSTVGNVSFLPKVDFNSGQPIKRATLGDVDNDGKNDLMVSSSGFISVFRNLMGLNLGVSSASVSCNGGTNGQINLSASSLNTVNVVWSNSATTFSLNNLTAGIYNYTLTSGSCILSESIAILQPAPIPLNVISSNSVLCEGGTATLTANGAATYSWSTGVASPSIAVSPSVTTMYLVTGTLNGCTRTMSLSQNVATFTVLSATSNSLLCEGETATLTASGASNYTWNGFGAGPTLTVNPIVGTTYTVTGTTVDGCSKTSTITQAVSNLTVSPVSSNSLLCEGETATLTADGALNYTWNGTVAGSSLVVSPSVTTIYTVAGTNAGGCSKTVTITQDVLTCTGEKELQKNELSFRIYPNPNSGRFVLELFHKDMILEIYDPAGKLVIKKQLQNSREEVDLEDKAAGVYFVKLQNASGIISWGKMIKK